jgi:hypothetical protein
MTLLAGTTTQEDDMFTDEDRSTLERLRRVLETGRVDGAWDKPWTAQEEILNTIRATAGNSARVTDAVRAALASLNLGIDVDVQALAGEILKQLAVKS